MKRRLWLPPWPITIITLSLLVIAIWQPQAAQSQSGSVGLPGPEPESAVAQLRGTPVMFIENAGQFAGGARFQVRGGQGAVYLAEDAIWYTLLEPPARANTPPGQPAGRFGPEGEADWAPRKGVNIKVSFPGANPHPAIEPFDRLDTHVSYFLGNEPSQWHPDVPVWGGVRYKELYPEIDLEISGEGGRLVQRITAGANSDPSRVRLRVEGADLVDLAPGGVRLKTALGDFTLPLLDLVGGGNSGGRPADLRPRIDGEAIAAPFNAASASGFRQIDAGSPASDLAYATYLGGAFDDDGAGIAVDSGGAAYVTGSTYSTNFPHTAGAYDASQNGRMDAYVVKLNAAGSALAYATFLGGNDYDLGLAIAVDASGAAYVTGRANSADFPVTAGAYDTSLGGLEDAFVVKLNASGSALAYATFLGGSSFENGYGIAVDSSEAAYVTGNTTSVDFPATAGAYDTSHNEGYWDAFVAKLNATGSSLAYGTFLGGYGEDYGYGIAVESSGAAYVTGETHSHNFPVTAGAFDTVCTGGCWDAFVAKLNATGSTLAYSTFFGGDDHDAGFGIAVNAAGEAYVTGYTVVGYEERTQEVFVIKLNATGPTLVYGAVFGGSSSSGYAIALDSSGAAYVMGQTSSSDFPVTAGAYDTSLGSDSDAFVVKLNAPGSALAYATYLGGSNGDLGTPGYDYGYGIAVDAGGAAYVTGKTICRDFPTTAGAYDTYFNYALDAFVAKLAMGESQTPTPTATRTPTSLPTATQTPPSTATATPTAPASDTTVAISPPSSLGVVTIPLTVSVVISNVSNLGGFQFRLSFNPTAIAVQDVTMGPFPSSTGRTVNPLGPTIDNAAGTADFGGFSLGSTPAGPTGSGVLARIRLLPGAAGTWPLDLRDAQATDVTGANIPVSAIDGQLIIRLCTGDLDGDGDVDILDVQSVAGRWNTAAGNPNYDPRFDLDNDGDIDILDVQTVAGRWNTTCE